MMKKEKLKKKKEEYLELRNELLEKGYTTDEIAEYLYYSDDYNLTTSTRTLCGSTIELTGVIIYLCSILYEVAFRVNSDHFRAAGKVLMMVGATKMVADGLYLNKKIPSYVLKNNLEKTVEMREVTRTEVDLEQIHQEEHENSEKVFTK